MDFPSCVTWTDRSNMIAQDLNPIGLIDNAAVAEREASLGRPRLLLADDHIPLLQRLSALLTPDYDVVGALNNGRDLVAEAKRLKPDLILLDITMPIMTGIEAAHQLREAGLTVKLIFVTVQNDTSLMRACFAEGGSGYVVKSHLRTDLIPAVKEVLAGRRFVSACVSGEQP